MTTLHRFRHYFRVIFAASAMILATATADAAVHYVTQGGAGNKDGSNWTNAYDEAAFPAAILSAGAGDEIWVKAGVYRPSITNAPTASFVLSNDVALYGGFAGTETSSADRNPAANLTVLTGDLANDDANKIGGVTVSADLIQGVNSERVVETGSGCGPTTVLDGFTVTAGDNTHDGGGMYTEHSPTVTNCAFSGNRTSGNGGGVCTYGLGSHAVIADCAFSGNSAKVGGGMRNVQGSSPTVTNCAFSGNSAAAEGGAMSNAKNSAPVVTNCTFSGNATHDDKGIGGGGMFNEDSAPIVTGCVFSGNITVSEGGGMCNDNSTPAVMNCTFSGNTAVSGGAMGNYGGSDLTATNCTFSGNVANTGGGIYNKNSSPSITDCIFSDNVVSTYGGGIADNNSDPAISGCTFSGNTADYGGGMYNDGSSPAVTNCTFSENNGSSFGGGICNTNISVPVVRNCTFSGNLSSMGCGVCCRNNGLAYPVVVNCILWGDADDEISCDKDSCYPTVSYCVVQGGYDDYGGTNNLSGDPKLGPLADNGGPTKTHALSAGSSAIDAASPDIAPDGDQRGVARPYPSGGGFDIGAYEYGLEILTVRMTGNSSSSVTRDPSGDVVGTTGTCWSYADGAAVALTAVEGSRDWFVTWSGDATGTTSTANVSMTGRRTVEAVFDDAWIITVSAGAGGDITPSAPGAGTPTVKVHDGANKTFTVTPNAGYAIGSVRVDGDIVLLGAGSTYTFANVSADHTIAASFTTAPAPTATPTNAPVPTAVPTTNPTLTPAPTATPTPVPTPDPRIPLPTATLKITLYAGGTVVAGPIDITDPSTLSGLLSSPTLLAQFLSERYNTELVRFFSLVADLDDGALDFTILFEVTVDNVPAGYRVQVFVLTRTFDSNGNPTGYSLVPRNEGANVFRKGGGATGWTETWRVTIRDGGVTDGDVKQDRSVAPQIAAVVAVFPMATPTVTVTPTQGSTGSGGGCSIPASGSATFAALLLLAPVVLMRRR